MATIDDVPINVLTDEIIGACIEVHRHLGPGMLESAYEGCVVHELVSRGLRVERQVPVPLTYKKLLLPDAYRMDIVVAGRVVLELKAVERLLPIHAAQLITYLRMAHVGVGLLLNFHSVKLRDQLKRFVNPAFQVERVTP